MKIYLQIYEIPCWETRQTYDLFILSKPLKMMFWWPKCWAKTNGCLSFCFAASHKMMLSWWLFRRLCLKLWNEFTEEKLLCWYFWNCLISLKNFFLYYFANYLFSSLSKSLLNELKKLKNLEKSLLIPETKIDWLCLNIWVVLRNTKGCG